MTPEQTQFLQAVIPAAEASMKATGIPASVTIAQSLLESGWGKSGLAFKANNYFGIKACHDDAYCEFPTTEFEHGIKETVLAKFASYPSAVESFAAHAHLLSSLPRYKPAMEVCHLPLTFAHMLQVCGYSTSPTYGTQLVQLINLYHLEQYDKA
jgi:flagellum-specific peptidoglycan hydrolase FlgJ